MNYSIPLVSIAMPVYNAESTVAVAIRSILVQSFTDWELLITDDGSSDRTIEVVRRFQDSRIRIWSDKANKGLPRRLNEMIEMSRGKYFARMDADDISYPNRLERQIMFLESNPDVDLVGAWMLVFGRNGVPLGKRTGVLTANKNRFLLRTVPIGHPTFLGKMEWFRKYRYAEFPKHFQDQHLLLRAIAESRFALIPEILLGYREESLTIRKQFRYRWSYIQSFPNLLRELGVGRSAILIAAQVAKLLLDILAISTKLDYRILKHRAQPLTSEELRQWQIVWRLVYQETVG